MIIGYLDQFTQGQISGWLGSFVHETTPFITANGKPCALITHAVQRPDVADATGLDECVGFIAEVPHLEYSEIVFELFAVTAAGKKLIDRKIYTGSSLNPKRFCSVFEALDIARQPNSVAIVCPDGTTRTASRAFSLYNIVKHARPSIIIAFDTGSSVHNIWPPLINSNAKMVLIPWEGRARYFELFRKIGLAFSTLWICEQDYLAFELAKSISRKDTAYILDTKDKTHSFPDSEGAENKQSKKLSSLMARRFAEKISQRSGPLIGSSELQATAITHARSTNISNLKPRQSDLTQDIRIGFIGTAAPDKGLIEAAKTINFMNRTQNYKIKLCIAGEFSSIQFKSKLAELGCELHDYIDLNNLDDHIQSLDLVLTGFPNPNADAATAAPSIIADALKNSRPILIPSSPPRAELESIEGIYLFNTDNFLSVLKSAVANTNPIALNNIFSVEHNYTAFTHLDEQAKARGPKFNELFDCYDLPIINQPIAATFALKNIVLIWKQHDSGLYGRRVDQIARSLAMSKFTENIYAVEIITRGQISSYRENAGQMESDHQYIYSDFFEKKVGMEKDGVFHQSLLADGAESFPSTFNRFLIGKGLYPNNTIFINFPAITEFPQLLKLLDGYRKITDVVDNQLSWASDPLPLTSQYLAFTSSSQHVVFNSEENRGFFISAGISSEEQSSFVPNWYTLPPSFRCGKNRAETQRNILYSGNMNDRIDWALLESLHDAVDDDVRIHLVGSADRATDELIRILEKKTKFVYHGPMRENELLCFAATCHLAVMPHLYDTVSTFMNPMKLNMYTAIGLRCISTDIPGIDGANPYLTVCKTSKEFIRRTLELISTASTSPIKSTPIPSHYTDYTKIIANFAE